jgi:hypothetical protein
MAENKRFSLEEIKKENVDLVSFFFFFKMFSVYHNDLFFVLEGVFDCVSVFCFVFVFSSISVFRLCI